MRQIYQIGKKGVDLMLDQTLIEGYPLLQIQGAYGPYKNLIGLKFIFNDFAVMFRPELNGTCLKVRGLYNAKTSLKEVASMVTIKIVDILSSDSEVNMANIEVEPTKPVDLVEILKSHN